MVGCKLTNQNWVGKVEEFGQTTYPLESNSLVSAFKLSLWVLGYVLIGKLNLWLMDCRRVLYYEHENLMLTLVPLLWLTSKLDCLINLNSQRMKMVGK